MFSGAQEKSRKDKFAYVFVFAGDMNFNTFFDTKHKFVWFFI